MADFVGYLVTVAETATYEKDADELFSSEEHDRLRDYLAFNPVAGDEIRGAGGVRQLLWPCKAKGKARLAQVIYFFRNLNLPLYMLAIYADAKPVEFDDSWRGEMAQVAEDLVREHGKGVAPKVVPESSA